MRLGNLLGILDLRQFVLIDKGFVIWSFVGFSLRFPFLYWFFFRFKAEESSSIYGFVNEKSGETVFSLMLPYMESMMDVCDTIIQRCKQLNADPNAAKLLVKSANLARYEANVCNNLSR